MAHNVFTESTDKYVMQAATAQGQYTSLMMSEGVSDDAKLIASAIVLSGAQIAEMIVRVTKG